MRQRHAAGTQTAPIGQLLVLISALPVELGQFFVMGRCYAVERIGVVLETVCNLAEYVV
jgi:hypothetical protein